MTPTTLALVERLANVASSGNGAMLLGVADVARFFALAMEHAAGIAEKTMPRYNWVSENADIYHAQNHMLSRAAAAIREAGK